MATKTLYIYMLVDPRNDLPFYVGRTINPQQRWKAHIKDGKQYKSGFTGGIVNDDKCRIIDSILCDGLLPSMSILDNCTVHCAMSSKYTIMDEFEGYWSMWARLQYDSYIVGRHADVCHIGDVEHLIQRHKHWLETGLVPKKNLLKAKQMREALYAEYPHIKEMFEELGI